MKEGFRQCMAWLHTWAGLIVGWVLFFVFLTGTAGYFNSEIDRWMRPELPLAPASDASGSVALAQAYLEKEASGADSWRIVLPGARGQSSLDVSWREMRNAEGKPGRFQRRMLNPDDGAVIGEKDVRATGGGHLLYRMHYELRYIPYETAIRIVGVCTMLMFMAILTGVVTHKKIFTDFFTFRPGKGQRSWLDAHNLISVTALPFFLMITYSGLVFFMYVYMPSGVAAAYGAGKENSKQYFNEMYPRDEERKPGAAVTMPLAPLHGIVAKAETAWGAGAVSVLSVQAPGTDEARVTAFRRGAATIGRAESLRFDAVTGEPMAALPVNDSAAKTVNDAMLALHEGLFAGPWLRWLYFLSGLLGCAMIGTGLVLWTVKRKAKQGSEFGFRLVECLNIGTIAGLPITVAVYFWANRLIPADFAGRREWEVHCMFIAWGLALLYPAFRPAQRAWAETLRIAAAAFALLPFVNALTTERHLGVTLPAGDWVLAGFDLTALALGVFFFAAARKVCAKLAASAPVRPAPTPATEAAG